jgi:sulfoxide reductase heme-binding subunit YedZ
VSRRLGQFLVVGFGLAPATWLTIRALNGDLGVDPVETLSQVSGDWTLRFLLVTLAITPASRFLGLNQLVRYRRTIGLTTFGYAVFHFSCFVWLDQWFVWADIVAEIADRLWITIGFATLLLLIPLAVTSTNGMVRRLGARRWRRLHRLVYLAGVGGVMHYWWAVKADTRVPLVYGSILAVLLVMRLVPRRRRHV